MDIIKVVNLRKYYGKEPNIVKAVDGINLSIGKGFTAVTGPSGSGKSTFLELIGGLRTPSEGYIQVNKTDYSIFDEEEMAIFRRRNLGFIFRQNNLLPILNVYENITFPLDLEERQIDRNYIDQVASLLKIEDKLFNFPKVLSTGERQKVSIARALSTKPAVILADEPTGNLDSKTGLEVIGLLKMTCKAFNQTIVLVTHDKEIAKSANQIVYLKDGKVAHIEKRKSI